ncbi:hypothetical protein [uncultured Thomasclavelia sp.]|uniref:hypothetical protein n=1 Tax=uncultured Thomasclavelia sp. TaxID=3025759 RepID=UPI00280BAB4B|nr:hypothetical protein [uncultured Thomasclavelia sp.]
MQTIKRCIAHTVEVSERTNKCQAAFNSEGRITLRLYNDSKVDTMIVFTEEESRAIANLFKKFKDITEDDLPF